MQRQGAQADEPADHHGNMMNIAALTVHLKTRAFSLIQRYNESNGLCEYACL